MKNYMEFFETSVYSFHSENNVLEEKDLGICADIASIRTPEYSVCSAESFQGCPYTDTGFRFDIHIDGERIKTGQWRWLPNAMHRWGRVKDFSVDTLTCVVPGDRVVVMKITVKDTKGEKRRVPLQVSYNGGPRYTCDWHFAIPEAKYGTLDSFKESDNILSCETDDSATRLTSSLMNMKMFKTAYLWENEIEILPDGSTVFYFSIHMGDKDKSQKSAAAVKGNYEELIQKSFSWFIKESERIYNNLPRLSSSEPELDNLYYRSLVTYMMCRWENPDLFTSPYFSTGSITGGCMCSYLWDYCGGLMLHPLYDTDGNKKEILAYLKNDLTTSYAVLPVDGGRSGPWYQVNQEKVICMVYYHILHTGEKEFLNYSAGEKTVLEWMLHHAYVCDDKTPENKLYDYGEGGNAHLELRRGIPYNGVIPDLNARRYMNYMRVYELTKLAGAPDERLPERAEKIKENIKSLWNEEEQWYDFIDKDGNRDIRYTVQMFKFLNSPVIDKKERDGLISHLNEEEFLSKFGLHSMSKKDIAFDQADIDNGGGGICTHFTMQICAQLYEMGYDSIATDIIKRVYWWGTRLPYMGDSCAANMIMNREDTPLQGDISSVSAAQMIFYYIFGIRADFDGNISITPVKYRPAENMRVDNARLCGKVFSVDIQGDYFKVTVNGEEIGAPIGETIKI